MQNYFTWLSKLSHKLMQERKWNKLIPCLNEMAGVMNRESRYVDELKLYMLMFHIIIDFGKAKFIDTLIPPMRIADERSGMSLDEKRKLFFEVAIKGSPNKAPANKKFDIYELCINNRTDEATMLIDSFFGKI